MKHLVGGISNIVLEIAHMLRIKLNLLWLMLAWQTVHYHFSSWNTHSICNLT